MSNSEPVRQFGFEMLDGEHFYHIFFHTVGQKNNNKSSFVAKSAVVVKKITIFNFYQKFQVCMTRFEG
jgi:hypothetical protein